ncbi:MAG: YceI family protein, partial [Geminicoccales bacterium]
KIGLSALSLTFAVPALAAETYYTDQGHTEVRFGWNHAGVSMQTGEFTTASGKLVLDPDNVEQSSINVTIDAASVSTGFEALDTHLKSADFLEVETYPEITFESTSIERTGEMTANITGDLTIHGVTKPVTLETTLTHRGEHPVAAVLDYYKGQWIAFSATTEIDHQAFDVGGFSTGPISIEIVTEMKDRE